MHMTRCRYRSHFVKADAEGLLFSSKEHITKGNTTKYLVKTQVEIIFVHAIRFINIASRGMKIHDIDHDIK